MCLFRFFSNIFHFPSISLNEHKTSRLPYLCIKNSQWTIIISWSLSLDFILCPFLWCFKDHLRDFLSWVNMTQEYLLYSFTIFNVNWGNGYSALSPTCRLACPSFPFVSFPFLFLLALLSWWFFPGWICLKLMVPKSLVPEESGDFEFYYISGDAIFSLSS